MSHRCDQWCSQRVFGLVGQLDLYDFSLIYATVFLQLFILESKWSKNFVQHTDLKQLATITSTNHKFSKFNISM
jgi:hypothetical protein